MVEVGYAHHESYGVLIFLMNNFKCILKALLQEGIDCVCTVAEAFVDAWREVKLGKRSRNLM